MGTCVVSDDLLKRAAAEATKYLQRLAPRDSDERVVTSRADWSGFTLSIEFSGIKIERIGETMDPLLWDVIYGLPTRGVSLPKGIFSPSDGVLSVNILTKWGRLKRPKYWTVEEVSAHCASLNAATGQLLASLRT